MQRLTRGTGTNAHAVVTGGRVPSPASASLRGAAGYQHSARSVEGESMWMGYVITAETMLLVLLLAVLISRRAGRLALVEQVQELKWRIRLLTSERDQAFTERDEALSARDAALKVPTYVRAGGAKLPKA